MRNHSYNKILKSDWLSTALISAFIPLHEKFPQFDWLRAVVFQLEIPTCENYKTFAGSSINK